MDLPNSQSLLYTNTIKHNTTDKHYKQQTDRQTDRQRQRERETERERETDRQRQKQTETVKPNTKPNESIPLATEQQQQTQNKTATVLSLHAAS